MEDGLEELELEARGGLGLYRGVSELAERFDRFDREPTACPAP